MSVGTLNRILTLLNVAAGAGIVYLAVLFLGHRSAMAKPFSPPSFTMPVKGVEAGIGSTEFTSVPLGRFPLPAEAQPAKPEEEKKTEIETALQALGDITNAVFVLPPYEGTRPAITFRFRANSVVKTITVGEALETRVDPANPQDEIPLRYLFVRCERDEKGRGFFVFDMRCDGTDLQRKQWIGEEEPRKGGIVGDPTGDGKPPESVSGHGVTIRPARGPGNPETPSPAPPAPPEPSPGTVEPVPAPAPPPRPAEPGLSLWDESGDTFEATSEGARFLAENYGKVIDEAQISTWKDPKTGEAKGLHVQRIREGSSASRFGVFEEDVILAINDRPVTSKPQAINIVKDEINRAKKSIIEVRILRRGREIVKKYDTRDPATRRAASKELRRN